MKKRYLIAAIICFVIAAAAVILILFLTGVFGAREPEQPTLVSMTASQAVSAEPSEPEEEPEAEPEEEYEEEETGEEPEAEPEAAEEPVPEEEEEEEEPEYSDSVDFQALKARNPDIYAWLYIPGTNISYAVVQSDLDDEYYLRRDLDGNYAIAGSIFSQGSYNNREMTDPVTVFYGHHMTNSTMFGDLQQYYSSAGAFAEHSRIIVYLPDRELDYTAVAAVPYDSRHIMASFDFYNEDSFYDFWNEVTSIRDSAAQFNSNVQVGYGDRLLILSTCLTGNNTRRYIVIARLDTEL